MILIPCGLYWTRTSDPIDVNDVLYQLSQQTITGNERHYIMHFVFGQGKNQEIREENSVEDSSISNTLDLRFEANKDHSIPG